VRSGNGVHDQIEAAIVPLHLRRVFGNDHGICAETFGVLDFRR